MYLADLLWTIPQNTNMQEFAMLQAAHAGRAGKVLPLEINSEVRACATYFKIRTQMQTQRDSLIAYQEDERQLVRQGTV